MPEVKLRLHPSKQVHSPSTYDPDTKRLTLTLNGGVFAYHQVEPGVADGLEKAESHGDYFHQHIRGTKEHPLHEHTRVR